MVTNTQFLQLTRLILISFTKGTLEFGFGFPNIVEIYFFLLRRFLDPQEFFRQDYRVSVGQDFIANLRIVVLLDLL